MKCPTCNIGLQMSDRQGVEIDYCPQCRGVWLDRGELDKIIEKVNSGVQKQNVEQVPQRNVRDERYDDDDDAGRRGDGRGRQKEGFLGNLFDF